MSRLIAIVLSALLLGTAMPAQAASFGLFFGDEESDFFPRRVTCMTDYQVRQAVAARGYSNIYLNVMTEGRVQVRATRGDWVYLLEFDYCRDRVNGVTRLRPAG